MWRGFFISDSRQDCIYQKDINRAYLICTFATCYGITIRNRLQANPLHGLANLVGDAGAADQFHD